MLDLILAGLFVAFGLAILATVTQFISIFITPVVVNSTLALLFSALANWLLGLDTDNTFIVYTVAGAFLGRALLALVEKTTEFRKVTINSVR